MADTYGQNSPYTFVPNAQTLAGPPVPDDGVNAGGERTIAEQGRLNDYYNWISSEGGMDAILGLAPDYGKGSYTDFVYGGDVGRADGMSKTYSSLGGIAQDFGETYSGGISDAGQATYGGAIDDANAQRAQSTGVGFFTSRAADGLNPYAANSTSSLEALSNDRLASGLSDAKRTMQDGALSRKRFLDNAALGPSSAAQDQLRAGTERSLAAQRALGGTVRGTGNAVNTTMSEALLEGNAANQALILNAEQQAEARRRAAEATAAGYGVELDAVNAANDQRLQTFGDSTNIYGQAVGVGQDANQFGIDANAYADSLALGGHQDAAQTAIAGGRVGLGASKSAPTVLQGGVRRQNVGIAGATGVRESEMDAGMNLEDSLTTKNAAALGELGAADLSRSRERAAVVKGISSGATDLALHFGRGGR
jgi:hypothetical protein